MRKMVIKLGTLLLAVLLTVGLLMPVCAEGIRYTYPEGENDSIVSPSALMMYIGVKPEQDVLLYEKDADVRYQPGALMRVAMMGYAMKLIREKNINMDETTGEYTLYLFNHYVAGTGLHVAMMNFGEIWTVRDLLTLCVIQTAADCAVTLATVLAGSPETFVAGLNDFARELGCTNSRFTNVVGLNEDGQYTTARDVMTFTRYAMEFQELEQMMELTEYTATPISGGKARSWPNSNDMIRQSSAFFYTYAVGGKTGGTLTETSVVEYGAKDGYEYMAVVMGAPRKDSKGEMTGIAYADARRLIRWGLLDFTYVTLARKNEPVARIPVLDSSQRSTVSLVPVRDLTTVVDTELVDLNAVTRKVVYDKEALVAPVEAGQPMGTLELYCGDKQLGAVDLVTGEAAARSSGLALWRQVKTVVFSRWFVVMVGALILVAVAVAVLLHHRGKRRRKSRKRKNIH